MMTFLRRKVSQLCKNVVVSTHQCEIRRAFTTNHKPDAFKKRNGFPSIEKLRIFPPVAGAESSGRQLFTTSEFLAKMRDNLENGVVGIKNCPEVASEILHWISRSLEAYDYFQANNQRFSTEQRWKSTDDIQRLYLNSQIDLLESFEMNFDKLICVLNNSVDTLDFKDLQACVLSLGCWPSQFTAGRNRSTIYVSERNHSQLSQIYSILEEISCKRLHVFHVKSVEFLIVDINDRIYLAKLWTHVLSENNFSSAPCKKWGSSRFFYECKTRTYPSQMVRKVGSNTGLRSHRFFSKLDPASFVEFMKVLNHVSEIDSEFHRYYVSFKMFQFIPMIGIEQLALVCRACVKHGLMIYSRHPIGFAIGEGIADKMLTNFNDLSSDHMHYLCLYLSDHFCQPSTALKVIGVQNQVATVVQDESEIFTLMSLISLASATLPTLQPSPRLAKTVAEMFLTCHPTECSSLQSLLKILYLCHVDAFGDLKGAVIDKVIECYKRFLQYFPSAIQSKDKVFLVLHLAYENRFPEDILENLFSDSKFCIREKKSNRLVFKPSIEYSNVYKDLMLRTAVKTIQSLVTLHSPQYQGPKFDDDVFEKYCGWLQICPPGGLKTTTSQSLSNWKMVGNHIKESIAEEIQFRFDIPKQEALERYVVETSVVPFMSTINYVFVLDSNFKIAPIPESFLNLKSGVTKPPSMDPDTHKYWLTIALYDSAKNCCFSRALNSYKSLHVSEPLKLGFHRVKPINMINFSADFAKSQDDDVLDFLTREVKSLFDSGLEAERQEIPTFDFVQSDFFYYD